MCRAKRLDVLEKIEPMQDSIPTMLSNREFVMNARAVDRYGPDFMAAVNRGSYDPNNGGEQHVTITGGITINMPNVRDRETARVALSVVVDEMRRQLGILHHS